MNYRLFRRILLGGGLLLAVIALAVSGENPYVVVSCNALGVDNVVPVGLDFHITTTNVVNSFTAGVGVTANSPWELVSPVPSSFTMSIGGEKTYEVRNSNDIEEKMSGIIILFEVDVEIDGVGENKEETEGAFAPYATCTYGYNAACVAAFKPVKIPCLPTNRPDNEKINLVFPAGHLLEKVGDTYQAAQSSYKVKEIAGKKFYLHGHAPSGALRDYEIVATHRINGCHDEAKYTVAKVEFNINPVVIGIGENRTSETPVYPATNPATYPYRVTATITPKEVAGSVAFASDTPERATVSEVTRSDSGISKLVLLKAFGVSKTPASAPDGDAKITAKFGGIEIASAQVVVIIPATIHSPFPQFDGTVTGVNFVTDETTSPSFFSQPSGYVRVYLGYYSTILTVGVDDQFGNVLNSIYAGAPVTEEDVPINQVLSPSSTYSDSVGIVNSVIDVVAEKPPGTTNPTIEILMSMDVDVVKEAEINGSPFTVEVEGHSLYPQVNRTLSSSPPNTLVIEWK